MDLEIYGHRNFTAEQTKAATSNGEEDFSTCATVKSWILELRAVVTNPWIGIYIPMIRIPQWCWDDNNTLIRSHVTLPWHIIIKAIVYPLSFIPENVLSVRFAADTPWCHSSFYPQALIYLMFFIKPCEVILTVAHIISSCCELPDSLLDLTLLVVFSPLLCSTFMQPFYYSAIYYNNNHCTCYCCLCLLL